MIHKGWFRPIFFSSGRRGSWHFYDGDARNLLEKSGSGHSVAGQVYPRAICGYIGWSSEAKVEWGPSLHFTDLSGPACLKCVRSERSKVQS